MIVSLSILSAPLLDLSTTIEHMVDCNIDRLHLDIMDGHYVQRMAFGIDWVYAIAKQFPNLPIDVHFMVQPVSTKLYHDCLDAGASRIWLHEETFLDPSLRALHNDWVLSLKDTPKSLPSTLNHCLVMSVTPGTGGQTFCPEALLQVRALQQYKNTPWIAVDGGVSEHNIAQIKQAGVNEVIMGHGLINAKNPKELIKHIHEPL